MRVRSGTSREPFDLAYQLGLPRALLPVLLLLMLLPPNQPLPLEEDAIEDDRPNGSDALRPDRTGTDGSPRQTAS